MTFDNVELLAVDLRLKTREDFERDFDLFDEDTTFTHVIQFRASGVHILCNEDATEFETILERDYYTHENSTLEKAVEELYEWCIGEGLDVQKTCALPNAQREALYYFLNEGFLFDLKTDAKFYVAALCQTSRVMMHDWERKIFDARLLAATGLTPHDFFSKAMKP